MTTRTRSIQDLAVSWGEDAGWAGDHLTRAIALVAAGRADERDVAICRAELGSASRRLAQRAVRRWTRECGEPTPARVP